MKLNFTKEVVKAFESDPKRWSKHTLYQDWLTLHAEVERLYSMVTGEAKSFTKMHNDLAVNQARVKKLEQALRLADQGQAWCFECSAMNIISGKNHKTNCLIGRALAETKKEDGE